MKIQKFDSQVSKKVLVAMIVHDGILEAIHNRLGKERAPFNQRWLDLVARWCLDHFAKYSKAPRRSILDKFAHYAESNEDEEALELVEKFLGNLSNDYAALKKDLNEAYILDLAFQLFSRVRLLRITEDVQAALEQNDLGKAHEMYSAYEKIEATVDTFEDPFSKEAIKDVFHKLDDNEPLVGFPNSLGEFLNPHFKRSDFVAFAGPEKRGKSYWLLETVWQALRSKRRVLYYAFGDMSKAEIYKRLYCRALRRPWRECTLQIPRRLTISEDKRSFKVKVREVEFSALRPKDVWEARKTILQRTASNEINLRVHVSGGCTVPASGIERRIKRLVDKEGWMPDVVVIDYADLLEPELSTMKQDVRHQMNMSWMIMRRIALDSHCLVVTATQAAASSYADKWVLRKGDFSEDKRKNAHVTGMLGINQSPDEKEKGVYRLNWAAIRDGNWSENQVVWTVGNLAVSMPCIRSAF